MVSPIKSGFSAAEGAFQPLTSALGRAFTPPGPTPIAPPTAPALPPPSSQPTAKPGSKGMQQSFLSGVAGSTLAGSGSLQGATTGKSLLGS